MNRLLIPLMIFAAVGLALSVTALALLSAQRSEARGRVLEPDPLAVGLAVPAFEMTDQDGQSRTQAILDGRVTVVDFIFTHCPFACPIMTMAMNELHRELAGHGVRFLSISVDPVRDTPERLRRYADDNGADTKAWNFLTGDSATVERIVTGSLQFALQPDPAQAIALPDGSTMDNIVHPTKLILVGPDRRVLGFYDPNVPEDMSKLRTRARLGAQGLVSDGKP